MIKQQILTPELLTSFGEVVKEMPNDKFLMLILSGLSAFALLNCNIKFTYDDISVSVTPSK